MGEYEAQGYRRVEETLLVSHDQVVSVLVGGDLRAADTSALERANHFPVLREIPVVHNGNVKRNKTFVHRPCRQVPVGILEPLPDLTQGRAVTIVEAIAADSVDEEKREHLDIAS